MEREKELIGTIIKNVRKNKGVTATHLSAQLGYTPQWLNNIENNRRPIKAHDLEKVARILDVDISIFFNNNYNATLNEEKSPTGTDN